nr:ribonuclease H-like domain-containing protein [Tanacetum cinerariifolium]
PQVVSAAKLPILNPNEFDLWKIRIEQYFLMTDYSLWEVILNGDSPAPTRVIEGVVQPIAPTTAEQRGNKKRFGGNKETKMVQKSLPKQQYESFTGSSFESLDQIHDRLQKLISQLEILRESLHQEDINLKFLRSLLTEWRTHTLIWRKKTDLEEQSLDDLFNSLTICEVKVKSSSSASTSTQNIAFVSTSNTESTNEPVSAAASVSAVSTKILVSALPNIDTLSNAVIYSFFASQSTSLQLDNDDLKQIDADDLKEIDLQWECMSLKDTRRNGAAAPQRRNVPVETSTSNALVSQCDGVGSYDWSFQAEEEPTSYALMVFTSSKSVEARLLVYQQNETVFEEAIKLLKLKVQLRDNALVVLRQKFEKAEQKRDDLKLKLESQLLASQTNDKTELGYNTQVFTRSMFDCDNYFTFESDESLPPSLIYDTYQSGDGYHAVPPPYTGTFMLPKPDLVFHDAPNDNETVHTTFNVDLSPTKHDKDLSHTYRCSAPIIEDWVSDSEDDSEAEIPQHAYSFVQPIEQVKIPRPSDKTIETSIPLASTKTAIPKPTSNGNRRNRKACFKHVIPTAVLTQSNLVSIPAARPVTATVPKPLTPMVNVVKGNWGNPQHTLKDKGVIYSRCSRHMIGNMSYLSNFEELNGRYVTFGGNPKGGKISGKGKIRIEKLDFDDVYFVKELKFNIFSVSQMCDKKNNVLFNDTECLVLSPEFNLPDENQVLLRVPRENNMYNVNLKNIVPSGDLNYLFSKAILDESNLWHRRLGHINFKTMNKLVKGNLVRGLPTKVFENDHTCVACMKGKQHRASCKFDGKVDEGFLVGYSNTDRDATFKVKEHEFERRKPGSKVHVSPSSSAHSKKHDDKTKREAKGKSPVESLTRYKNLSAEFEDFSGDIINEVNAADSLVPAVGQISTNSTNTFSAAGPSNAVVSPTHGKSSYVDSSQLLDDPNMLELEDITYSDDEYDVGAEADFNNLETSITISPIPTTRVHKDHHDLRNPDYPDKVYKVVKALYGLHQASKAWETFCSSSSNIAISKVGSKSSSTRLGKGMP